MTKARLHLRGDLLLGNMREVLEHLIAGGVVPLPSGKMAEADGPAGPCGRCGGKGTEPDPKGEWLDKPPCMDCDGVGRTVAYRIVPDPMALEPWISADRRGAARLTATGAIAATVENESGTVSTVIRPDGAKGYRVFIGVCEIGKRGHLEQQAWEVALRLADTELRHHGYRC